MNEPDFDEFDPFDEEPQPLAGHESEAVQRELEDLTEFERAFAPEGYKGVAVFCQDCREDHFYLWDMLRTNLAILLETGRIPMHEPAFNPDPKDYVPWEYARGYVDAMRDAGVDTRIVVDGCGRCGMPLEDGHGHLNFCARCGSPLLAQRLRSVLSEVVGADRALEILRRIGLPAKK